MVYIQKIPKIEEELTANNRCDRIHRSNGYKTLYRALVLLETRTQRKLATVGSVCIEIVEGNPHLRSLLSWHLQQVGYRVHQAASLYQAQEVFLTRQPTLVILDAELKDHEGIEFCHWLQRQQQPLILMLSTRNAEADIVAGLKAGADDYLTKPFGMQEFLARVEALIRRKRTPVAPAYLDYGALQIDLVQRRVCFHGEFIDLTPQEFSLLYVLAQAGGIPLSRLELLRRAWPEAIDNPRTIDTHVLSLRKKVETDPRQPNLIQTVRNVGYRFNMELLNTSIPHVSELQYKRVTNENVSNQRSALSGQF